MEGAQVKELIQRWRVLSNDLKLKNKELEDAREALNQVDSEHTTSVQQWDLEKENIKNTINAIVAQVTAKKDELQRIEKETQELRRKVDERRRRNEEHLLILNKRRQIVETQTKEAEERDAGIKERLAMFEKNREEARKQLQSAIQKIEDTLPQELEDHQQKVRQLRSRMAETAAVMEAEAKSWALEQAMREWHEKSDSRKWLLEEVNAAEAGKDIWADLAQEANNLQMPDFVKELGEIRALTSMS